MDEDIRKSKFTECYVAFLDILGWKSLISESENNAEKMQILIMALNKIADIGQSTHSKGDLNSGNFAEWKLQIHAFSDNVILFIPIKTKHINFLLAKVAQLYDELIELNCCLRGGIIIGDMYWDDDWSKNDISYSKEKLNMQIAMGQGLIEAVEIESKIAIYPRIVISEKLQKHIQNESIQSFPLCAKSEYTQKYQLIDFVSKDIDGIYFLDILHPARYKNYATSPPISKFENGKWHTRIKREKITNDEYYDTIDRFIQKNLRNSNMDRTRMKFEWLNNYLKSKKQYRG